MPYTTKAAIENYLQTDIDPAFDTQLTEYIAAMSRYADEYTGRTLVAGADDTTCLYDGNGEKSLRIDDVVSITEVTVDDVVVTPFAYPANTVRRYRLELSGSCFTVGQQNVSVTGRFGYFASLPTQLKFAVTVLVAGIVNQVKVQADGVKSETVGSYTVTYKDAKERSDFEMAMKTLAGYSRISF